MQDTAAVPERPAPGPGAKRLGEDEEASVQPPEKKIKVEPTSNGGEVDSVEPGSEDKTVDAAAATATVKSEPKLGKGGQQKQKNQRKQKPSTWNEPGKSFDWLKKEYVRPEGVAEQGKLPKRKVALLMGYCGKGYIGMQLNPDVPTIELELFKALASAGAVSSDNAMDPMKISFVRAARTDKGVHAAGQVCSLKMIIEDKDIVQKLNELLPPQIRIWGYVRVSKGFHAKNACDSRIYEYILPTYVLQPCSPVLYPRTAVGEAAGMIVTEEDEHNLFKTMDTPRMTKADLDRIRSYRAPAEQLEKLQAVLKEYVGSNNFHNFTTGIKFEEKRGIRNIKSFECGKPFVREGIEWVSCKVHGQSFMLHQIRKMIGLAIMIIRTGTSIGLVKESFKREKLNIPKAPALGLLLEQVVYATHNKRGPQPNNRQNPGEKEPVDFEKYKDEIAAFKEEWIYSNMVAEEMKDAVFNEWLRVVDARPGDYAWFLNKDGTLDPDRRPPYIKEKRASTRFGESPVDSEDELSEGETVLTAVKVEPGASTDTPSQMSAATTKRKRDDEGADGVEGPAHPAAPDTSLPESTSATEGTTKITVSGSSSPWQYLRVRLIFVQPHELEELYFRPVITSALRETFGVVGCAHQVDVLNFEKASQEGILRVPYE
ncbi:tRNA pseudouridine synthase 1 [Borealophlyctis nickersoniae]|nr:tRNA pseudouridine synthase 1 [Borealophlyctis nickersoniae]